MTQVFRFCDEYVTRWAALDPVAAGARGPVACELAAAAAQAHQGYRDMARYLLNLGPIGLAALAGELATIEAGNLPV